MASISKSKSVSIFQVEYQLHLINCYNLFEGQYNNIVGIWKKLFFKDKIFKIKFSLRIFSSITKRANTKK